MTRHAFELEGLHDLLGRRDLAHLAAKTPLLTLAIALDPVRDVLEPGWLESARAPLRPPPLRDEPGLLQHFEVLGYRRQAELERLGELQHRRLTVGKAGQDRPPRRVGERLESRAE